MGNMAIRNLPDDTHDWLREEARRHGRSVEEEVRSILIHANRTRRGKGFGAHLATRFEGVRSDNLFAERDQTPATPMDLED